MRVTLKTPRASFKNVSWSKYDWDKKNYNISELYIRHQVLLVSKFLFSIAINPETNMHLESNINNITHQTSEELLLND